MCSIKINSVLNSTHDLKTDSYSKYQFPKPDQAKRIYFPLFKFEIAQYKISQVNL